MLFWKTMDFDWAETAEQRQNLKKIMCALTLQSDFKEIYLHSLKTGLMYCRADMKRFLFEDDGSMDDLLFSSEVSDGYIESKSIAYFEVAERSRPRLRNQFRQSLKRVQSILRLIFLLHRRSIPRYDKPQVRRRRSVRFNSISRTHYLHDGLTAKASVCMTYGSSDAGKTAAIASALLSLKDCML